MQNILKTNIERYCEDARMKKTDMIFLTNSPYIIVNVLKVLIHGWLSARAVNSLFHGSIKALVYSGVCYFKELSLSALSPLHIN